MRFPSFTRVLAAGLLAAAAAWPWSPDGAPHHRDLLTEVLKHRQNRLREPGAGTGKGAGRVAAILPDAGQIAVLDDSEGVFVPGATFDLDNRTLRLEAATADASEYTYVLTAGGFDPSALTSGTALRLGDDDAVQIPLPFSFPYYGQRYNAAFVHSDGNLTFSAPEPSSLPRSLGRLLTGPPRVAPLFADLDPSQPGAAISYVAAPDRLLITWNNVPLYADAPGPSVPRQTLQAVLFPSGRLEFSYRGVILPEALVGIAPGGATDVQLVDFSAPSATRYTAAIVEAFSDAPFFDEATLSEKFYRNHEDAYDFLVVFDTVQRSGVGPCPYALTLKNQVRGIGLGVTLLFVEEFDASGIFGSAGRLQTLIYMGPLSQYPADPAQSASIPECGRFSTLSALGQEAGHRFLAYPLFVNPETNTLSAELLGRQLSHWSFFLNTDASLLEGNQIQDRGEGAMPRFITRDILQRYSSLDQYLMGLRAPGDVPPTFLVRNPSIPGERSRTPESGVPFDGTRVSITVPMIVQAEGPRAPDHTVSPKQFRFAFAVLLPSGQQPSAADVEKIDRARTAWESFFNEATANLGTAETRLGRQLALSVWPSAGVLLGRTITGAVTLAAPAAAPLTVNLTAANASVGLPGAVTIPAGSRTADFVITGANPGAAEIAARVNDTYETARAAIQVRTGAASLVLERLETSPFIDPVLVLPALGFSLRGGPGVVLGETLRFRVRDDNFVPFPGLRLNATASGSGAVAPSPLVTNAQGIVDLQWRLDTRPGANTLSVSLEGQPEIAVTVRATGVAQPFRRRGL